MKMAVRIGNFTQMMLKASIGAICTSFGTAPILFKASVAGAVTIFHSLSQNVRLRTNATPTPPKARRMRERNSSRCSRNDMRSIPSSSGSSPESGAEAAAYRRPNLSRWMTEPERSTPSRTHLQ